MLKRVIGPGLLAGLLVIVWMIVVNGMLGFRAGIDMKSLPDERRVYDALERSITEPGRYICNPEVTASGRFPDGRPVFSVMYGGVGHESAGRQALAQVPLMFAGTLIAAWMLSVASERILRSYPRRVLFIAAIGLVIAVSVRLTSFGIGDYPAGSAIALAMHDIALWSAVGLVLGWRIRRPA